MKIESIYRSHSERKKESKDEISQKRYSKSTESHPFMAEREYVRALNAVKLERLFASPFIASLSYHKEGINNLVKNKFFASSSYDNSVVVWDLSGRRVIKEQQFDETITGIAIESCQNIYASQNNSIFCSGTEYKAGSVVTGIDMITIGDYNELGIATNDSIQVFDVYRTTPKVSAVGKEDGVSELYDIRNLENPLNVYRGHTNAVVTVAFNPNGKELATGSFDRTIRIFDLNSRKSRDCYYNDRMQIVMEFNTQMIDDGQFIISGSDDGSLRIWKSEASKKLGPM